MSTVIVKGSEVSVPETPLLRYHQREDLKHEIDGINDSLNPHNKSSYLRYDSQDAGDAVGRARRLQKQLDTYSPQETDGATRDKLAKRAAVLEEQISVGMPTAEEMRKNPAGMVGRHMRWEKANKKKILEWKNIQIALDPTSNDPDLANFERLRPSGELDRFRSNAQISGHMTYGNIPQTNWDRVFPIAPESPLVQAKKREASEVKVDKRKRQRTEEEKKALRAALATARARKAAKQSGEPLSPQEGESVPFEGA